MLIRAAIVSIGDEIALGQSLDTNSQWLAARLATLGALAIEHVSVPDDEAAIADALARLGALAPIVVCTGGLGPTADDLTRAALARATRDSLIEDPEALAQITAFLARRARPVGALQRTQALRPSCAATLRNEVGTAPGLRAALGDSTIWCLPGPPGEMRPMFERETAPGVGALVARAAAASGAPPSGISTRFVHCCAIAEADAAERLGPILDRARKPTVGITVANTIVTLRIRHEGPLGDAPRALDDTERDIRAAMGAHVFGAGDDTLPGAIRRTLFERRQTIACVESCTGGMLLGALSDPAGASGALQGGWVTYSNEMKQREVGVPENLIRAHGAVSEPVARAMAEGGLARAGADYCLAVTGIAGPAGGSDAKPIGTVFVALARANPAAGATTVRRFLFSADRAGVRLRTVQVALAMLWLDLQGAAPARLVGETALNPSS